jgi:hypothetical protein
MDDRLQLDGRAPRPQDPLRRQTARLTPTNNRLRPHTQKLGHPLARTVLISLGIPLTAGYLSRRIGLRRRGRDWYERRFIPKIAPITLYGLLFTIVVLFAIQGDKITSLPLDVVRIALPLLAYFAIMWIAGFAAGRFLRFPTHRPPASRSPSPPTTSSSRSQSPSESSAPPPGRHSPASSDR